MAGPYHIDTERLVFKPDNLTQVLPVTPTFFQDLDKNFDDFKDHMLVTRFAWDEAWPTWEIHPNGDELVFLLSGDTDFVLWIDGEEQVIRISEPGSYVVVPANTWHTARPHADTSALFVTPGEGTLNAEAPS